jgi:hypothetical protein
MVIFEPPEDLIVLTVGRFGLARIAALPFDL